MGSKDGARERMLQRLLRWRWPAMLLFGLSVTIMELIEHTPLGGLEPSRDFFQEVLLLGVLMPTVIGACLTAVARIRSEATVIRITAVVNERSRLARDLHDTVGQNLAAMRLTLERLGGSDSTSGLAPAQHELSELTDLVDCTYEQVRSMLAELRPPTTPDLQAVLLEYAHVVGRRAHFDVQFRNHGEPRGLSERTQREVLAFYREALINIEKHARARRVCIDLTWLADGVNISLVDDGQGFDPQTMGSTDQLGLQMMRERAQVIKGNLTLRSRPFVGTEVSLRFPLDAKQSL